MDVSDIRKQIKELKTDEEIENFILSRLKELEDGTTEKTVGQDYTDTFSDFISSKVHYKAAKNFYKDQDIPDLVYDDINMYKLALQTIKKSGGYSDLTVMMVVTDVINTYLKHPYSSNKDETDRFDAYFFPKDKKQVSIKEIAENQIGFCSERAGMAQNLLKFLGYDSEVVCGERDGRPHAYNLYYPKGYDGSAVVIYDPSFYLRSTLDGSKFILPYFSVLDSEQKELFKEKEPIELNFEGTIKMVKSNLKEDIQFDLENPSAATYQIGLEDSLNNDKNKAIKK